MGQKLSPLNLYEFLFFGLARRCQSDRFFIQIFFAIWIEPLIGFLLFFIGTNIWCTNKLCLKLFLQNGFLLELCKIKLILRLLHKPGISHKIKVKIESALIRNPFGSLREQPNNLAVPFKRQLEPLLFPSFLNTPLLLYLHSLYVNSLYLPLNLTFPTN